MPAAVSPAAACRRRALPALLLALVLTVVHPPATVGAGRDSGTPSGGALPAHVLGSRLQWQMDAAAPDPWQTVDTSITMTGAPAVWDVTTGQDAVVALIDTGVTPVAALDGAVVGEVDFTGTGGGDGYGHGTFLASLIAGRDPTAPGVAPGAGILSLKVADADGDTELAAVLGALAWLAGPGRALGIDVAVLAAGVPADSPAGEVLDLAVQRLARLGVLVVTAAGNDGPGALRSPASSPGTLSVGAVDHAGTVDPHDDIVADFSATGPDRVGAQQPDLRAGGVRVVGAIGPDSALARGNPDAVQPDGRFRGSGTSMAAALTAGVAALVADAHPGLSGAQVGQSLRVTPTLDAAAALEAASRQPAAAPGFVDPSAAAAFAEDFLGVASERAEALAAVAREQSAAMASLDDGEDRRPDDARARHRARRSEVIEARAARQAAHAAARADRTLAQLERRLLRDVGPAPHTAGWTAARWSGQRWAAGSWAAGRWAAHDWAGPAMDPVGWDGLLAGVYGVTTAHWDADRWSAAHWEADLWDGTAWDARTWGARDWESLHWGAVRWDADHWEAVRWDAVGWDPGRWEAVQWGAGAWAALHAATAGWSAVQWGAVQWGAVQWGAVQWGAVQWGAVQWGAVQWAHLPAPPRPPG